MRRIACFSVFLGVSHFASPAAAQQVSNPFETVASPRDGRTPEQTVDVGTGPVAANGASSATSGASSAVTIGSVHVGTAQEIAPETLAGSYADFIGREATEETLQALATAVSSAAREQGYVFASASIPPQSVRMGMVAVRLDPGPIDEVRVLGSKNKRLRAILEKLRCNAAQSDILERQLLLAGDLHGITVKSVNYERESGRGVLVVNVSEDTISGYAAADNYGPESFGPIRARIEYDIAGLLSDDDVLTTRLISTALQPSELVYFNSRYARTLGGGSTVIGASGAAGRTRWDNFSGLRDFRGRTLYASLFAGHALKRSRAGSLWVNAELDYLAYEQSGDNGVFQDDRIITATISFSGNYDFGAGRVYGGIGVTQGLGVLGASRTGDPLNSRANGSGEFTKVNAWVNTVLNAGGGFGMRLAANGQIASRPLLSPNEIALGGPYFGKGYDFSERFGDEGILALTELRKEFSDVNQWLDWFQLYGFVDGGYVDNIGSGEGDGSLASAGGGMRAQMGPLDMGLEVAAPLTGDRYESGDQSPKINVQVGLRF